jgi:hypothetical protein
MALGPASARPRARTGIIPGREKFWAKGGRILGEIKFAKISHKKGVWVLTF